MLRSDQRSTKVAFVDVASSSLASDNNVTRFNSTTTEHETQAATIADVYCWHDLTLISYEGRTSTSVGAVWNWCDKVTRSLFTTFNKLSRRWRSGVVSCGWGFRTEASHEGDHCEFFRATGERLWFDEVLHTHSVAGIQEKDLLITSVICWWAQHYSWCWCSAYGSINSKEAEIRCSVETYCRSNKMEPANRPSWRWSYEP